MIQASDKIDVLVEKHPELVRFLIDHDLPCVVCGEPFWGSLGELCAQKQWTDKQIQALIDEFNATLG